MTADLVHRPYTSADVERLRGSVRVEHTLARLGAERLRYLLAGEKGPKVPAFPSVVGAHHVGDVLDRDDDDERPEDE